MFLKQFFKSIYLKNLSVASKKIKIQEEIWNLVNLEKLELKNKKISEEIGKLSILQFFI
jgi:Leucine-rich repeat (LRR) protein